MFALLAVLITSGGLSTAIAAPLSTSAVSSQGGGLLCAREVPSGSIVNSAGGTIIFPNGSVVANAAIPCSMTSVVYSCCSSGPEALGTEGGLNLNQYFASFQDQWTRPPNPSSGSFGSNQGVGLFDALVYYSTQNNPDIIQPLLTYGCITSTDCSNSFRLTAYALIGSIVDYATPVSTSNGDTIQGVMTYYSSISGCINNGPGYGINAKDTSTGTHSILYQCTSDQYPLAYAGALEPINLSTCTQMPGTTSDAFGSVSYTTSPSGGTATTSASTPDTFCTPTAGWNSGATTLTLGWKDS